jgi:cyclohexadienyl dehydratase
VGTTADYPPFSAEGEGGELEGIDVELARVLAAELGARAVFVRTSWGGLLQDLAAGRFDLAMSGISIDPERARAAAFSRGYCPSGKTPLVRRGEGERFRTLELIDREGVRVVTNPGGTNQRFAEERLRRARVSVHPDNLTVFRELIEGRADVMITDSEEATYRARVHPELERALPDGAFDRSEKGILLPRDPALQDAVDAWLLRLEASGELARVIGRGLAG